MWADIERIDLGASATLLAETEDSLVVRLDSDSGEGMMTFYRVFPGVLLTYNDFHMKDYQSEFQAGTDLFCIDHCREGRIEHEIPGWTGYASEDNLFSYLAAGDLRLDRRLRHNGHMVFPLCHYHGLSITFLMDEAARTIAHTLPDFSVDLCALRDKYCSGERPCVISREEGIAHIFSELYHVPAQIRRDYFRIKVLELLLFLDALTLPETPEARPYFYRSQVEKVKAIQAYLTADLTRPHTLEELSARFDIAMTPMKECFKAVYGSPIFTYMRLYRMNVAAAMLKSERELKVSDIAGLVGYDSPSKFAAAFRRMMGMTPLAYRNSADDVDQKRPPGAEFIDKD